MPSAEVSDKDWHFKSETGTFDTRVGANAFVNVPAELTPQVIAKVIEKDGEGTHDHKDGNQQPLCVLPQLCAFRGLLQRVP